jgi:lipopolysaccharide transport system ATP-binding protein
VGVYTSDGVLLYWSFTTDVESTWIAPAAGSVRLRLALPAFFLNEGTYRIDLGVALFCRQWLCEPGRETPGITVEVAGGYTSSRYWTDKRPGLLAPALTWKELG